MRVGADGPFKLGLNEVRIGLTLPWFAIVLARHRLTPAHFDHAAVTGDMFDPESAREAGLLDASGRRRQTSMRSPWLPPRTSGRSTGQRMPPPSSGCGNRSSSELRAAIEAGAGLISLTQWRRGETGHPSSSDP